MEETHGGNTSHPNKKQKRPLPPTPAERLMERPGRPSRGACLLSDGRRPLDDTVRCVADFLKSSLERAQTMGNGHIEIEGRLGWLIDRREGNRRVQTAARSESLFAFDGGRNAFDSGMSRDQHAHYNRLLNEAVAGGKAKVRYEHTRQRDSFFFDPNSKQKYRFSTDETSGKSLGVLIKRRISDMEITVPGSRFDYRITVSLETSIDEPPPRDNLQSQGTRRKDRMTYIHDGIQVDLTQVRTVDTSGNTTEPTHELEIELRDIPALLQEKSRSEAGQPNAFNERIEMFVNTLRSLNRKAISG